MDTTTFDANEDAQCGGRPTRCCENHQTDKPASHNKPAPSFFASSTGAARPLTFCTTICTVFIFRSLQQIGDDFLVTLAVGGHGSCWWFGGNEIEPF